MKLETPTSKLADEECPEEITIVRKEQPEQIVNTVLREDHGPMSTEGNQADDCPDRLESCSRI